MIKQITCFNSGYFYMLQLCMYSVLFYTKVNTKLSLSSNDYDVWIKSTSFLSDETYKTVFISRSTSFWTSKHNYVLSYQILILNWIKVYIFTRGELYEKTRLRDCFITHWKKSQFNIKLCLQVQHVLGFNF